MCAEEKDNKNKSQKQNKNKKRDDDMTTVEEFAISNVLNRPKNKRTNLLSSATDKTFK